MAKNIPLELCKKECDDRKKCKSIDVGRGSNKCNLNSAAAPVDTSRNCLSYDLYIKATDCQGEKNSKNKEFYYQGKLQGSWSVTNDKTAFGGQPIVINEKATWTIKGAVTNG